MIMKKSSLLMLAALLPLVACQTSDKEVTAASNQASTSQEKPVEAMAMASFELAKVP